MNSRRLTSGMGSPPEPAMAAYRTLRLPWKRRQVLGVDLNRSELAARTAECATHPLASLAPSGPGGGGRRRKIGGWQNPDRRCAAEKVPFVTSRKLRK